MTDLTALIASVQATVGIEESAIVFIQGLQQKISDLQDSIGDPVALQQQINDLQAALDAEQARVAAAIATNP